jgi:hypothetical protein
MEIVFNADVLKGYGLPAEEIDNLEIFLGVNIFGVCVPSTKSMEMILNEWNKKIFVKS